MADGADQSVEAPGARRGPWARIGLALAGLACLGAAAAAGWKLADQGAAEYRKVFLYQPATAVISQCEAPAEGAGDRSTGPSWLPGRPPRFAGRATYEFVLGERLFTGEFVPPPPRKHPTGYEIELSGPQDVGSEVTVYYDPRDPRRNTVMPVADIKLAVIAMVALPVAAWGLGLLFLAMGRGAGAGPGTDRDPVSPQDRLSGRPSGGVSDQHSGYLSGGLSGLLWGLVAYSALSLAGAAGVYLGAPRMAWQRAWILALGLGGAVIPLASLAAGLYLKAPGTEPAPHPSREKRHGEHRPIAMGRLLGPDSIWAMATVMIVGGLLVAGLSGYLAAGAAWRQWDALRRLASAPGSVLSVAVEQVRVDVPAEAPADRPDESAPGDADIQAFRYRPRVTFLYRVGGNEYVSGKLTRDEELFADAPQAQAVANKYPRSRPVTVYYDSATPAEGVLIPSWPLERPQWLVCAPLAVFSGMLCAALGAALPLGARRVRKFLDEPMEAPCRIPSMGILQPTADGLEIHRRRSPIAAAWLGYAAVAGVIFAAASLRQQRTGETMSLAAVVYGTISCLCAATACGLLVARKTRLRLVVDTQNRLLLAGDDRREVTISFDDLAAWTVSWAEGSGGADSQSPGESEADGAEGGGAEPGAEKAAGGRKRSRTSRVPVLGIRTTDDQEARVHLFTGAAPWRDRLAAARKTAEELADITGCAVEMIAS